MRIHRVPNFSPAPPSTANLPSALFIPCASFSGHKYINELIDGENSALTLFIHTSLNISVYLYQIKPTATQKLSAWTSSSNCSTLNYSKPSGIRKTWPASTGRISRPALTRWRSCKPASSTMQKRGSSWSTTRFCSARAMRRNGTTRDKNKLKKSNWKSFPWICRRSSRQLAPAIPWHFRPHAVQELVTAGPYAGTGKKPSAKQSTHQICW